MDGDGSQLRSRLIGPELRAAAALAVLKGEAPGDVAARLGVRLEDVEAWALKLERDAGALFGSRATPGAAFEESWHRFMAVLDSTSAIAAQWFDRDGRVLSWNQAAEQLYGWPAGEAVGRPLDEFFLPADEAEALLALFRRLETGEGAAGPTEKRVRHRDGHQVSVLSIQLVVGGNGAVPLFVCLDIDLTPVRDGEARLKDAMDLAERASRAKSQFLANMSHEIRTPMNAVTGFAELALLEPLTPTLQTYLQHIHDSGHGLLALLNDVLDLAKIEAGKLQLEVLPFEVEAAFARARVLGEGLTRHKEVSLEFDLDPALPRQLLGDALRVGQVLTNLVSNAVKFTSSGEVRVAARLHAQTEQTVTVAFGIADSGIGMSAEHCARLFEPFTQADGSTTRLYGGTGLGLAITRQLVELMHGTLTVESVLGVGSRFTVCLPLGRVGPATVVGPPPLSWLGRFQGLRALLVEDNLVNQHVAISLLKKMGFHVETVGNGRLALEHVERTPGAWDIVFMDLQMPEMDGLTATRRLRERYPREQLPIVAMTANAFEQDRQACLEAGMDEHVPKPLNPALLAERVAGVFARR